MKDAFIACYLTCDLISYVFVSMYSMWGKSMTDRVNTKFGKKERLVVLLLTLKDVV